MMADDYFSWGPEDFLPIELVDEFNEHFPLVVKIKTGQQIRHTANYQESDVYIMHSCEHQPRIMAEGSDNVHYSIPVSVPYKFRLIKGGWLSRGVYTLSDIVAKEKLPIEVQVDNVKKYEGDEITMPPCDELTILECYPAAYIQATLVDTNCQRENAYGLHTNVILIPSYETSTFVIANITKIVKDVIKITKAIPLLNLSDVENCKILIYDTDYECGANVDGKLCYHTVRPTREICVKKPAPPEPAKLFIQLDNYDKNSDIRLGSKGISPRRMSRKNSRRSAKETVVVRKASVRPSLKSMQTRLTEESKVNDTDESQCRNDSPNLDQSRIPDLPETDGDKHAQSALSVGTQNTLPVSSTPPEIPPRIPARRRTAPSDTLPRAGPRVGPREVIAGARVNPKTQSLPPQYNNPDHIVGGEVMERLTTDQLCSYLEELSIRNGVNMIRWNHFKGKNLIGYKKGDISVTLGMSEEEAVRFIQFLNAETRH